MSEIRGCEGVLPPQVGYAASLAKTASTPEGGTAVQDSVEISDLALTLSADHSEIDAARQARISDIRASIKAGTYLTADKLNFAIDQVLKGL